MIYFIADPHFGDMNIMKYESRPFPSIDGMQFVIKHNWNATVNPDDEVYVLGDVGNIDNDFLNELNGIKYLVKGNHDTQDNQYYRDLGFKEVYDKPILLDSFWILSHEPLYINENMPYANLFGHVHNNPIYKTCSSRSYCVCVERINYTPISFDAIKIAIANANKGEEK